MSAGKGSQPRAVNGDVFRRNYEEIFAEPPHIFMSAPPLKPNQPEIGDALNALQWCASWLDTLSDHLRGRGLAWEMLGELSRKRRDNPALDEAFDRVGWTREAEANFFKARLIPEGDE